MTAVAALACFAAVWLLVRPGGAGLDRCRARPQPAPSGGARVVGLGAPAALASVVTAGALGGGRAAVLTCAVVGVLVTAALVVRRVRSRARGVAERAEVAWAGEVLAGLLRAGHVPATALLAAASETAVLRSAAGSQRVGGDVASALVLAAESPGREGLADLATAWVVAERTGASLAEAVGAMAEQLAGRQEVERTVAAELAAPRATGRIMAILRVAGLGLGYALGGHPLGFLLEGPAGWACLLLGVGLACGGVLWTESLADRAGGS